MERQKYNKLILETLSRLVDKHPDIRFGQFLVNCEIVKVIPSDKQLLIEDPFYEESEKTWKRMLMNKFCFREQYN